MGPIAEKQNEYTQTLFGVECLKSQILYTSCDGPNKIKYGQFRVSISQAWRTRRAAVPTIPEGVVELQRKSEGEQQQRQSGTYAAASEGTTAFAQCQTSAAVVLIFRGTRVRVIIPASLEFAP